MQDPQHIFDPVSTLKADAVGEPGQRLFRLLVDAPQGSATLWLEKELLYSLATAVRQLIATLAVSEKHPTPLEITEPSGTGLIVDLRVRNLALGYDPETHKFSLLVHEEGNEEDSGESAFLCWASQEQMEELASGALKVCASGRPLCPLCHSPMGNKGHFCPKKNGNPTA